MPVCFDRKIAFIHIPKTAGQSIEDLFEFELDNHHYFGNNINNCRLHLFTQESAKNKTKKFSFDDVFYNPY